MGILQISTNTTESHLILRECKRKRSWAIARRVKNFSTDSSPHQVSRLLCVCLIANGLKSASQSVARWCLAPSSLIKNGLASHYLHRWTSSQTPSRLALNAARHRQRLQCCFLSFCLSACQFSTSANTQRSFTPSASCSAGRDARERGPWKNGALALFSPLKIAVIWKRLMPTMTQSWLKGPAVSGRLSLIAEVPDRRMRMKKRMKTGGGGTFPDPKKRGFCLKSAATSYKMHIYIWIYLSKPHNLLHYLLNKSHNALWKAV